MVTRVSEASITPSLQTTPIVVVPLRTSWLAALFCAIFSVSLKGFITNSIARK
jgi:hypothetical protein